MKTRKNSGERDTAYILSGTGYTTHRGKECILFSNIAIQEESVMEQNKQNKKNQQAQDKQQQSQNQQQNQQNQNQQNQNRRDENDLF